MAQQNNVWVEQTKVCFIDNTDTGAKKCIQGVATGNSGSPGYLWISGDCVHYTDNNGAERKLNMTNRAGKKGLYTRKFFINKDDYIRYVGEESDNNEWEHSDHANNHSDEIEHTDQLAMDPKEVHENVQITATVSACSCHSNSNHGNHSNHGNTLHHSDHLDTI